MAVLNQAISYLGSQIHKASLNHYSGGFSKVGANEDLKGQTEIPLDI